MRLLPVSDLTEGMFVAKALYGGNNLLLAQGMRLDASTIRLLQAIGIATVYVEQAGTDDISVADVIPEELRVQCEQALAQAFTGFRRQAQARHITLNPQRVQETTFSLVEEILARKDRPIALLHVRDWSNRLYQHSVNTAVLATTLARELGHSEAACRQLAMGMIFHDCGQLFLPRELFEKRSSLTPEERKIVEQHTRVGFQNTWRDQVLTPLSAYIVLHHHERVDGNGYPDGLTQEEIHPMARIASVVEAYDAMTSLRPYGRTMMPDQAFQTILDGAGTIYDRDVALLLAQHIAIYPTGSAVRLNTGERGIVVSAPIGNTTRPTVRLFYAADGRRMRLEDVDLSRETDRWIEASGLNLVQVKPRPQARRRAA